MASGTALVGVARAQEPLLKRLTTDDGLSQNTVQAIIQDRRGFMWFGTAEGLNRFDGYEFVVYKHDPADPHTPASDYVTCLFEDGEGALWLCAGDAGVDRFDPDTGRFTHYRHDPNDPRTLSSNTTTFIQPGRGGTLIVGTLEDGLNRLDPQTGLVERMPLTDDAAAHFSAAAVETREGPIWIAATLLLQLDPATGRLTRHFDDRVQGIRDIVSGEGGTLWLGTSQGLAHMDPASGRLDLYPPAPNATGDVSINHVNEVFRDTEGQLWVGTPGGLYRFDPATKAYTRRYQHDPADPTSLASSSIAQIYEDPAGLIWIGTIDNGVSLLDRRKETFASFRHDPADVNSLFEPSVHAVRVDSDGTVWIGTSKGVLTRYDPSTGRYVHYRHDPSDPASIRAGYFVRAIERDGQGRLWVAGWNSGLNRLDEATGRFETFYEGSSGLSSDNVLSLHTDRAGGLWIGTIYGGLNRLDLRTGRFRVYRHDSADRGSIAGDAVSVLTETRDGTLWAGTWSGGLSRYDEARDRFVTYRHDPADRRTLPPGGINVILEASDGVLWVGTSGGLGTLNPTTGAVDRATDRYVFPNMSVQSIQEDAAGRLWIGTRHGLVRFDPAQGDVRTYDVSDGLPADDFHDGAAARGPDGRLYFGTSRGLLVFDPDRLSMNRYSPPVVLTELRVLNEPVRPGGGRTDRALWATEGVTLTHRDYVFSLTFAALSYGNPEKNRYRYRLEGLEDEWNVVGADRREARYSSLPPGDYVFRVQGANEDGVWNEDGATLRVRVLPPWWGTWWFRSFIGLLAMGGVWGMGAWRVRSVERHRRELAGEVEARTHELHESNRQLAEAKDAAEAASRAKGTFLANMSHEFRTPLNAVLGFTALMARDERTDPKHREYLGLIHESGTHLLGLISDVLDMSKVEAGRVTVEEGEVDLEALIPPLVQMLGPSAQAKGLTLTYAQSGVLPQRAWTDEQKLRQILLNLLSNAVKFTREGEVAVHATHEGGRLTVTVKDTGPGIALEEQGEVFSPFVQTASGRGARGGTGLGLAISQRLTELLGGHLTFTSTPGQGSTFVLDLPVPVVGPPHGDGAGTEHAPLLSRSLPTPDSSPSAEAAGGRRPYVVTGLPAAWTSAFQAAAVRGSVEEMLRLSAELEPAFSDLSRALTYKVNAFDFEAALSLVQGDLHGIRPPGSWGAPPSPHADSSA